MTRPKFFLPVSAYPTDLNFCACLKVFLPIFLQVLFKSVYVFNTNQSKTFEKIKKFAYMYLATLVFQSMLAETEVFFFLVQLKIRSNTYCRQCKDLFFHSLLFIITNPGWYSCFGSLALFLLLCSKLLLFLCKISHDGLQHRICKYIYMYRCMFILHHCKYMY